MNDRARAVLTYWFDEEFPDWPPEKNEPHFFGKWFGVNPEADTEIKAKFQGDLEAIGRGDYDSWLNRTDEALAGIVLMDQFSRNMHRGTPQMYSLDSKVQSWAAKVADSPGYATLHPWAKLFVALPFMHAEALEGQQKSLDMIKTEAARLEKELGADHELTKALSNSISFSQKHMDIVEKWGRFPHRNAILGRESTAAEAVGLEDGTIGAF